MDYVYTRDSIHAKIAKYNFLNVTLVVFTQQPGTDITSALNTALDSMCDEPDRKYGLSSKHVLLGANGLQVCSTVSGSKLHVGGVLEYHYVIHAGEVYVNLLGIGKQSHSPNSSGCTSVGVQTFSRTSR